MGREVGIDGEVCMATIGGENRLPRHDWEWKNQAGRDGLPVVAWA